MTAFLFFLALLVNPASADTSDVAEKSDVADTVLEGLHDRGRDLQTLRARVDLTDVDLVTGNEPRRRGQLFLRRHDDGVRFRAVFPGRFVEGPGGREEFRPEKIEYFLDGDDLLDRNYVTRTQVTRRLPPSEAGRDLLKLGEGPFPLPIGQPPAEVRRLFSVTQVDVDDPDQNEFEEPAADGTIRLRLTPRQGTRLADEFAYVDLDATPDGELRKVMTLNRGRTQLRITDLLELDINGDVPDDAFTPEPIDRTQWNVIVEEF